MKNAVKYFFLLLSLIFLVYLSLPGSSFPNQLPDAIRSGEPADMETPLRREYYTDILRSNVMDHYLREFSNKGSILYPTYRLNYPPEESQTRVRDQTRSTYLEEIVHPFRESIYVNGMEPKLAKDVIVIDDKNWNAKVIVRYLPSNVVIRIVIGILTILMIYLVFREWKRSLKDFVRFVKTKRWTLR